MAEWDRIVNTTIREYIREEEESIMRDRKFMAMVKDKGRLKYNCGGNGFEWKVKVRRGEVVVNNGEESIEFGRVNRHENAYLTYQGLIISERMTKREKLMNRGKEAIIQWASRMGEDLKSDMGDTYDEQVYIDSSASGNGGKLSGLETMFATNGTITVTSGAQRTANAADPAGYPSDTYAGLSTELQQIGGSWGTQSGINNTWPYGRGDAEFDAWSPVIVNYTSTAFLGGSNDTWAENALAAIRFGLDALKGRVPSDGQPDVVLLDRGLYREFKALLDSKERINIENSGMRKLGFKDVVEFDGVDVTSDYGVPSNVGYILNFSKIQVRSMQENLFELETDYSIPTRSWHYAVDHLGQFQFKSPRYFGKLLTLA